MNPIKFNYIIIFLFFLFYIVFLFYFIIFYTIMILLLSYIVISIFCDFFFLLRSIMYKKLFYQSSIIKFPINLLCRHYMCDGVIHTITSIYVHFNTIIKNIKHWCSLKSFQLRKWFDCERIVLKEKKNYIIASSYKIKVIKCFCFFFFQKKIFY